MRPLAFWANQVIERAADGGYKDADKLGEFEASLQPQNAVNAPSSKRKGEGSAKRMSASASPGASRKQPVADAELDLS